MFKGTTVVCVRRQGRTALGADGQVTLGSQIVKGNARKVRRLHKGTVLAGFAGGTADAMTLLESFERRLEEQSGHLLRAAAFLVKEWRTDKVLRRLEAMLLVADREQTLLLSGSGDILEPEGPVAAIGSGAGYALAAARALCEASEWEADRVARRSLELASEICIYTNAAVTVEVLA